MKFIAALAFALLLLVACGRDNDDRSQSDPAILAHEAHEEDLATIQLTADAVARLGIQSGPVERRMISLHRTVGGELMSPVGGRLGVTAPQGGYILPPGQSDTLPMPGTPLEKGQTVLRLLPVDTSQQTSSALEEVSVRESEAKIAKARFDRLSELLVAGSSSQEQLDIATTDLTRAETALRVARAQRELFLGQGGGGAGGLTAIEIAAPVAGVLTDLTVARQQAVAPGDPLFTVEERHRLWVKVPLYAGDVRKIDRSQPAAVAPIGSWDGSDSREASVVMAPGSADAGTATVDLYYEVVNVDNFFQPGERVSVKLPLLSSGETVVVPFSAVFRDIHDGAWVYEQVAERTYVRTRVVLNTIEGDLALLADGPEPGTTIVTVGVAELVGTEFGVGH